MDTFLVYLQKAGPFTAPLCVAMVYALWWMNRERLSALQRAEKYDEDAKRLREKRAEDLEKFARELAEFGESVRLTLREWTEMARQVLTRGD